MNFIRKIYSKKTINKLEKKIKLLGIDNYNINKFLGYRLFISLFIFLLLLLFSSKGYIYGPIISIFIYLSFEYILDKKISNRTLKLNNEAIFYFQVLSLALEGGKNLQNSIKLACDNVDSEISNEFKKSLKEMQFGKSLNDSLKDLRDRIPSEEINTVILNIIQSNKYGNDIVDSLNNQINYLSDKKLLNIKSVINKMPIKISVISVIFMIPIIMLIVLGPIIVNFLTK